MTTPQRGIALVITLIALAVCSALGLGLVLTTTADRLTTNNYREAIHALNAAEAGLEVAARELSSIPNWDVVLAAGQPSRFADGPPVGPRTVEGTTIDLTVLTNRLTCGRTTACSDARVRANTSDRPWGANNPRWQPFVYGRLSTLTTLPRAIPDSYVIVWVGDDARERDGESSVDGGGAGNAGRDVVRVRAEAFSAGGTRRAVEADVARPCENAGGIRSCAPGIRVQSWRGRDAIVP